MVIIIDSSMFAIMIITKINNQQCKYSKFKIFKKHVKIYRTNLRSKNCDHDTFISLFIYTHALSEKDIILMPHNKLLWLIYLTIIIGCD